jgi:hypothetical protein
VYTHRNAFSAYVPVTRVGNYDVPTSIRLAVDADHASVADMMAYAQQRTVNFAAGQKTKLVRINLPEDRSSANEVVLRVRTLNSPTYAPTPDTEGFVTLQEQGDEKIPATINGNPVVGQTVSTSGTLFSSLFRAGGEFQWQTCSVEGDGCEDIPGATSTSLRVTDEYVDKTLRLFENRDVPSASIPTAVVTAAPNNNDDDNGNQGGENQGGGSNENTDQGGKTDDQGGTKTDNQGGNTDQGGSDEQPVKPVISLKYKNDRRPANASLKNRTNLVIQSNTDVKVTGRLVISKALAKKLKLKSRIIATAKGQGSGDRVLAKITFTKAAIKALKGYKGSVRTTVTVKAPGADTITGSFTLARR